MIRSTGRGKHCVASTLVAGVLVLGMTACSDDDDPDDIEEEIRDESDVNEEELDDLENEVRD
jgi:hypothetical protein